MYDGKFRSLVVSITTLLVLTAGTQTTALRQADVRGPWTPPIDDDPEPAVAVIPTTPESMANPSQDGSAPLEPSRSAQAPSHHPDDALPQDPPLALPADPSEEFPIARAAVPVTLSKKELPPEERQGIFLDTLLPAVIVENASLVYRRQRLMPMLELLRDGANLPAPDAEWLAKLAEEYQVEGDVLTDVKAQTELTRRLDVIPPGLVLAQAALESGWGSSLAAQRDRDLFGMLGVVSAEGKKRRDATGAKQGAPRFAHVQDSVKSYMHNLNIHAAYQGLREMRANARAKGKLPEGRQLAEGLTRYSILGKQYVKMVQSMIRQHDLSGYDQAILVLGPGIGDS